MSETKLDNVNFQAWYQAVATAAGLTEALDRFPRDVAEAAKAARRSASALPPTRKPPTSAA